MTRRRSVLALLFLVVFMVSSLAFWALRPFRRAGGDTAEMSGWVASRRLVYYYRAPGTFWAHVALYRSLKPFGWTSREAMGLNSALAGGLFAVALLAISRHPAFLLVNLATPAVLLFAGHEENYGYVNALLVLFLACGLRVWRDEGESQYRSVKEVASAGSDPEARTATCVTPGRSDILRLSEQDWGKSGQWRWAWFTGAVFALGCAAHLLTVFYLPALLALGFRLRREEGAWRFRRSGLADSQLALTAPFVVLMVLISVATMAMHGTGGLRGLDNNMTRMVPLRPTDDIRYFFTMFSWGHLKFLGFLYLNSAPLALPVIAALVWKHGRGAPMQWLALSALCGALWTFVWHPDLLERDWDLFANVGFPLNVWGGLLLERAVRSRSKTTRQDADGESSDPRSTVARG